MVCMRLRFGEVVKKERKKNGLKICRSTHHHPLCSLGATECGGAFYVAFGKECESEVIILHGKWQLGHWIT